MFIFAGRQRIGDAGCEGRTREIDRAFGHSLHIILGRVKRKALGNHSRKGDRGNKSNADIVWLNRLGIELTKILVLQSSNQETSVTIGESVRDEDGTFPPLLIESQYLAPPLPEPELT